MKKKMGRKKVMKDPQEELDAECKLLIDEATNLMKVHNYTKALSIYQKVKQPIHPFTLPLNQKLSFPLCFPCPKFFHRHKKHSLPQYAFLQTFFQTLKPAERMIVSHATLKFNNDEFDNFLNTFHCFIVQLDYLLYSLRHAIFVQTFPFIQFLLHQTCAMRYVC